MPIREQIITTQPGPSYDWAIRFFTGTPTFTKSGARENYSISESTYISSLQTSVNTDNTLYFVLHRSSETSAGTYTFVKPSETNNVVFEITIYKDGSLLSGKVSDYFDNSTILRSYYDRLSSYALYGNHNKQNLPIIYPHNSYDKYHQSASGNGTPINYFNIEAFYLDSNKIEFTPKIEGTYLLVFTLKECTGGADIKAVYQPYYAGGRIGPLWFGNNATITSTILAQNEITVIVQ